jgi:hypothetical protein
MSDMKRREFMILLGGRGLPLAARALATAYAASLPESSACGGSWATSLWQT